MTVRGGVWLCLGLALAGCDGSARDTVDLTGNGSMDNVGEDASGIDPLAPVVTIDPIPAAALGGSNVTLSFSVSAVAALTDLSLAFRRDEARVDPAIALATSDHQYVFTLPFEELPGATFELRASDESGRVGTSVSTPIHVDVTPPSFVQATLLSPSLTNDPRVSIALLSCPEAEVRVAIAEDPDESTWVWLPCAEAPTHYDVSAGVEGLHTFVVHLSDALGNISPLTTELLVDYDASPPSLTIQAPLASAVIRRPGTVNVTWSAADAHLASLAIAYSANGTDFVDLALDAVNDGVEPWTLPGADGSTYWLRIIATDTLAQGTTRLSGPFTIDGTGPSFSSTTINYDDLTMFGDASTGTVFVQVRLEASDPLSSMLAFRLRETFETGDCQALFANNDWSAPQASPALLPFRLTPTDGIKKLCAWARDIAGNVSVIPTPTAPAGPDRDTIAYFVDNPPEVTTFDVAHGVSDTVITWTVNDAEPQAGLAPTPISLSFYTASGGWQPIADAVGPLTPPLPYTDSYMWAARPAEPYQVRIVALDKNGNTSIPVISDVRPADPAWSIVAGNADPGLGGSARSFDARWSMSIMQAMAADPKNGDIYFHHTTHGLLRLDVRTGRVERFVDEGPDNLLDEGGDWPTTPSARVVSPAFDHQGRLYLKTDAFSATEGGKIYQVDLSVTPFRVRHYVGGGDQFDELVTTTSVFVAGGGYAFDDDNTLYFFTSCDPGEYSAIEPFVPQRLMKVTQQPTAALARSASPRDLAPRRSRSRIRWIR